jgi:CBS domain-containing protein
MYLTGSWMTKGPMTLRESDDLGTAAALFKLGRVRHLPVVRQGKLVGLLTQRDLLRALGSKARAGEKKTPVKALMRTRLLTAHTTTPLREIARLMLKKKVGCVPIVGTGRRLLGIITESDLVRFSAELLDELDRMDEVALKITRVRRRSQSLLGSLAHRDSSRSSPG